MIVICNNDIMIFAITLVLFDLKSIISYLMHYNEVFLSHFDRQTVSLNWRLF